MKPSAFIVDLMARGERMEAWLTWSSRQPSPSVSSMSVCFLFPPTSVAPYSIIPSVINRRFCGVLSNYHFGPREAEKSIDELLVPRCIYCFKHVSSICWPRSWRGRRFVFRAFFSPIYIVLPPHISLISSLLIIERDKERDRRFVTPWFQASVSRSSVTLHSVSVKTFKV